MLVPCIYYVYRGKTGAMRERKEWGPKGLLEGRREGWNTEGRGRDRQT